MHNIVRRRAMPCGFARGYGVDEHGRTRVLRPPAGAGEDIPFVYVLQTEQDAGFPHLMEHSRTALSGADVLEVVRLAWKPHLQIVLESAAKRQGKGARIWVLEHETAFRNLFETSRVKVCTEVCFNGDAHRRCQRDVDCPRADDDRPTESVIRSVHPWGPIPPTFPILYAEAHQETVMRYLVGEMDVSTLKDGRVKPDTKRSALEQGKIDRYGILEPPTRRGAGLSYVVTIRDGSDDITVMVGASRQQSQTLNADPERFVQTHDVVFTGYSTWGMIRAIFLRRP